MKILPNLTGIRTDEQFDEFIFKSRNDTVSEHATQCSLADYYFLRFGICARCYTFHTSFYAHWLPVAQAVVNFGSSWCSHCHKMFPHYLNLTSLFPKLKYAVAQVDFMVEAPRGITYTPTFAVYRKGRKVDQFYGANEQQLRDHLWLHCDER